MRARAHFYVEWELGEADDYPEEVVSWNAAALDDLKHMGIRNMYWTEVEDDREIEVGGCLDKITIEDADGDMFAPDLMPFERSGDGPDATFSERPYIPPPSPFYADRDTGDEDGEPGLFHPDLFDNGHVRK